MTTIPSGNPGGHKANGSAGVSFGAAASGGSAPYRKMPLPHIDDLTSVTIDYDPYTPIDKLLAIAEDLLRQAETYRTFGGRIDMAMMSYIKANILLLDVVKKNKGWVSLQADNKAQKQRYSALVRQAQAAHSVFEEIKSEIKVDNARTGIQPKVSRPKSAGLSSTNVDRAGLAVARENRTSLEHGASRLGTQTPTFSPTSAKAKPSVRPKPEALHGHAVQPTGAAAKRAAEDLTSRFAKLRTPTSASQQSGVQDPRIRTQPIVPSPQAERRDAVARTGRSSLSIDDSHFELPQMPGAIYKPARGTVSTEAAELPSSSSRRFSLARSLTSGSLNSATAKPPVTGSSSGDESKDRVKRPKLSIPEGETLSVTELLRLMREGSKSVSILLIDIRSREAFDEGHIMSQATICIEPEVLMRKNISASEIVESMVLAPSAEQINFERRHGFDLVVFYDQYSTRIGTKKDNPEELAVRGLYNALTYFDYAGETNPKPPKLLEGGLDAWTSVMGSNSVATTESSVGRPVGLPTKARPSMHNPALRQSYVPKPIQDPDEARRWEESTNDPRSFKPAMTVDDFMRRYPKVSDVKESMISTPDISRSGDGAFSLSPETAHGAIPAPPTRPAPTVTRPSFAGLEDKDETEPTKRPGRIRSEGDKKDKKPVGLRNPGNWCYANSSLQALFGTSDFAHELFTGQWENLYRVPRKEEEKIPNPQLLAKMLSQLFAWMDKAMINPMEARTLMQYTRHIHSKDDTGRRRSEHAILGGTDQHDAQEFLTFITEHLHDETNIHRNEEDNTEQIPDNDHRSLLHNAVRYWQRYTAKHDSIVTKYWRCLITYLTTCPECVHRTTNFQVFDVLPCSMGRRLTLDDSLKDYTRVFNPDSFFCPKCKDEGRGKIKLRRQPILCRLPDRLAFQIGRFDGSDPPKKNVSRFSFPIRGLDMEPYWIPPNERSFPKEGKADADTAGTDPRFCPPFKYDCYAVICHIGKTLKHGHYIAYVRDQRSSDPTDWLKFNDTVVTPVKVGSGGADDIMEELYRKGDQQAYLLFYQRNHKV
ncbi:cysteine proteinase [Coniochaeta ligniaria NRRL 30616]|uniref:ubiquitinyl hydrolase 1 n=1 Tax=Coniochaeta ligniaria NRRL 30616 TaxID=1408157 RepID=A0A1J7ICK4_9PEZI|nr:cysteine proteinase [Coniochaeta ligniaria NRRL 30616]